MMQMLFKAIFIKQKKYYLSSFIAFFSLAVAFFSLKVSWQTFCERSKRKVSRTYLEDWGLVSFHQCWERVEWQSSVRYVCSIFSASNTKVRPMEAPIAFIVKTMYIVFLHCSIVESYIDKDSLERALKVRILLKLPILCLVLSLD